MADAEDADDGMDFQEVTRKRSASGSSTDSSPKGATETKKQKSDADTPNKFLYIAGKSENITILAKSKPVALKKDLISIIGANDSAKITGQSIRIAFNSETQRSKLLQMTTLMNVDVIVSEPRSIVDAASRPQHATVTRGIIFGVPEDINDEELVEEIGAEWVRRIVRRDGDSKIPTTTVIIAMKGESLPDYVAIGFLRKRVKAYIPLPMRCFRCQNYGHKSGQCNAGEKCPRCGGKHKREQCDAAIASCPNCHGEHSSGYNQCPKYVQVHETLATSVTQKVSYAEAARRNKLAAKVTLVAENPTNVNTTGKNPSHAAGACSAAAACPAAAITQPEPTQKTSLIPTRQPNRRTAVSSGTQTDAVAAPAAPKSAASVHNSSAGKAAALNQNKSKIAAHDETMNNARKFVYVVLELIKSNKELLDAVTKSASSLLGMKDIEIKNVNSVQ
jgi:hypothetical protein